MAKKEENKKETKEQEKVKLTKKEATRNLLQRKIEEKKRQIQEKMRKQLEGKQNEETKEENTEKQSNSTQKLEKPPPKKNRSRKLSAKERRLLEIIEEKLDEESEEAQFAEAGITGSEFFKKFQEESQNEENGRIDMDAKFIGNQIEAYLNRQRQDELDEFAQLEQRLNRPKR